MRPEVAICPTCEFPHRNSPPSTSTITWSDDCACRDLDLCLYHRIHSDEPLPKRPAHSVMEERRAKVEERQNEEFEKKKQRFARAEALEKELAEALGALRAMYDETMEQCIIEVSDETMSRTERVLGVKEP